MVDASSEIQRFDRRVAAPSHYSSVQRLFGGVRRRAQDFYHRWFCNRNHVYVHRGPAAPPTGICLAMSFAEFASVPTIVRDAVKEHGGPSVLATDESEMAANAELWVAFLNETPAGMLFVRRGRHFAKWFVPLAKDDIVIYRVRTYEPFRGKGIAPALMRTAMHHMLHEQDSAYIDCRIYNKPSIRSIEKAGFTRVATMRPISRGQALGHG